MKVNYDIQAGICGFRTQGFAESDDMQHVTFDLESGCGRITELARRLADLGPVDAYSEIGGRIGSVLLTPDRGVLTGCCTGCAVPLGMFKAMQVAAGLALPADVSITMTQD